MRDNLTDLRNQLEESRLQALRLHNNLERSEEAGMRDMVTLIGNRRFFEIAFAEELEKARRTGETSVWRSPTLTDLSSSTTDFGHLVGDRLLRLFAEILVQNVSGQDRVARFGGEEFAFMLPGARLRRRPRRASEPAGSLNQKQWTVGPTGERVGTVTASFGVAKLRSMRPARTSCNGSTTFLRAKAKGRNCVVAETTTLRNATTTRSLREVKA